jgi:hypothetical protein
MKRLSANGFDVPAIIRESLNTTLGELATQAALSYTGDASDGDLVRFTNRTEALFRTSAPMVFSTILWWCGRDARLPRSARPAVTKRPVQRPVERQEEGQGREEDQERGENKSEKDDIRNWRPTQRSFRN